MIQPEVEAAATLIRHALRRLRLPQERVLAYLDRFHRAMMLEAEAGPSRDHLPQIADITLGPGELADRSLREARIRERLGVTIVAVTRADGQVTSIPPPTRSCAREITSGCSACPSRSLASATRRRRRRRARAGVKLGARAAGGGGARLLSTAFAANAPAPRLRSTSTFST